MIINKKEFSKDLSYQHRIKQMKFKQQAKIKASKNLYTLNSQCLENIEFENQQSKEILIKKTEKEWTLAIKTNFKDIFHRKNYDSGIYGMGKRNTKYKYNTEIVLKQ